MGAERVVSCLGARSLWTSALLLLAACSGGGDSGGAGGAPPPLDPPDLEGNLALDFDLIGARHKHQRVHDALAHNNRAILRRVDIWVTCITAKEIQN